MFLVPKHAITNQCIYLLILHSTFYISIMYNILYSIHSVLVLWFMDWLTKNCFGGGWFERGLRGWINDMRVWFTKNMKTEEHWALSIEHSSWLCTQHTTINNQRCRAIVRKTFNTFASAITPPLLQFIPYHVGTILTNYHKKSVGCMFKSLLNPKGIW